MARRGDYGRNGNLTCDDRSYNGSNRGISDRVELGALPEGCRRRFPLVLIPSRVARMISSAV